MTEMRRFMNLVESREQYSETIIDDHAINMFGKNISGSGALAIAIFNEVGWPIVGIYEVGLYKGEKRKIIRWVNLMPSGRFMDIFGSYTRGELMKDYPRNISLDVYSRDEAMDVYQEYARIPVKAAKRYVKVVIKQATSGKSMYVAPTELSEPSPKKDSSTPSSKNISNNSTSNPAATTSSTTNKTNNKTTPKNVGMYGSDISTKKSNLDIRR